MKRSTLISPNKHTGRTVARPRVIVIHTMESSETTSTAENVAAYFARPSTKASAHWCVDSDSAVRCVADTDTAWAAPGANHDGLQMELAGRAGQGAAGWDDPYSRSLLENAAILCAEWATTWDIPIRHLSVADLTAGARGFIGHVDASEAYKKSDHWDPGPDFPWATFLARVTQLTGNQSEEDDMFSDTDRATLTTIATQLQVPGQPFGYPAATHNALAELIGKTAGLQAAVTTLATAQGVDPATITATINEAVTKALADISITLSAKADQ